jgi:hypothetical protein
MWLAHLPLLVLGQLSIAHNDSAVEAIHRDNPFFARSTLDAATLEMGVDATKPGANSGGKCPTRAAYDLQLAWTTNLGASVYSSPLLVPTSAAGRAAVWTNTFVRYAEAVDGVDGHELPGWPYAFTRATFHTSPLAYDVDGDGVDEMLLLTFDGEVVFLSRRGLPVRGHGFKLPKLKVRKDWYAGLHDIHTTPFKRASHRLVESDDSDDNESDDSRDDGGAQEGGGGASANDPAFGSDIGAHGGLSADAEASFGLFAADEGDDDGMLFEEAAGADADEDEPRLARWAAQYEDEEVLQALYQRGLVMIDAHALSTPTLVDVDGDGALELVVAVSYFLEDDSAARLARHGVIVDKSDYVAGGILAIDPSSGRTKWSVQLDLTTEKTKLRAYIYSPVTVADLDGDGNMEVAVGTSMGFLYVLDGRDGALRDGFPVQMNEIQAQVVAADVDADGALELLAADAVGSVAAWRADGTPLWEVQTSGLCAQGVTLTQSIRGDGSVQVVVPTVAGVVHVLEGKTGAELAPFPLLTDGRILSAVLVLQLRVAGNGGAPAPTDGGGGATPEEPHLVFSSFDGFMYVVNARTGCYERVDIGEHSYTQVLADDLTGNGKMDLLLSTMNGNLYCFETQTPYSPMRAWRSQAQGRNVWQQREGFQGVEIEGRLGRHAPRSISGASFDVEFTIHDKRAAPTDLRWHRVEVRLGRGGALLLNRTYYRVHLSAGGMQTFRERLRCPAERTAGVLSVSVVNEHGQLFEDAIAVTFNEGFEHVLNWVALLPFAMTIVAVATSSIVRVQHSLPL